MSQADSPLVRPRAELKDARVALRRAKEQLRATRHTMALEAQRIDQAEEKLQLERLARELIERAGSTLWDQHD